MRFLISALVVLGLGTAAVLGYQHWHGGPQKPVYRTAEVTRGDIRSAISATGTVEPEEVVDVGAQVLGRIESRGRDPQNPSKFIDYMSQVEEGTVLAQIDASIYRAQVEQARATVAQAAANVEQQRALLNKADRDWVRAQGLRKTGGISEADYDLYLSNFEAAKALLGVTEATLESAKAALKLAEVNLGYTTIISPVKGVIVDRRVNVGQTVVSSLTAPSLFLIAKDLTRLQVWASVNEADIGQVHLGQSVQFTVDAFPNETFLGEVTQIRLNATMTQNVVTYTVVVTTDNSSGRLLPYLTANLNFEVSSKQNVLLVPNAALHWQPRESGLAAARTSVPEGASAGRVWTLDGDSLKPIAVSVLLSDGSLSAIESDEIREGMQVILGESTRQQAGGQASPFAPNLFRSGGSTGGTTGGRGARP